MTECYNVVCPYCVDYKCRRTCTCDMRLDGEYVKIVRCKNCKYHEDEELGMVYCPNIVGGWVREDFYCGDGDRKDESTMGQVNVDVPVNETYTVKVGDNE